MSTKRAFYEYNALVEEYKVCPEHVPEVYGYHPEEALICMQLITPHIILRKGMMEGIGKRFLPDKSSRYLLLLLLLLLLIL
jgi:5-methylthioribose kinase